MKTSTTTTIFRVRSLSLLLVVLGLILVLSGVFVAGLTDTAKADSVISTIPVGTHPQGIAFDPANGEIYVANAAGSTISVISSSTNPQVIATIPLNMQPRYIVFDSANKNMYVAGVIIDRNPDGTSSDTLALSVISSSTNQVIATIPIAGGAQEVGDIGGIAFDPANGNIYVTSILTNTAANVNMDAVLVIDTSTNKVIATLGISGPGAVAFDPANGDVYVASGRSNTVNVIDPATNQVLLPLIRLAVAGIAFDPANGDLYMTGLSTVSVISSSTNQVIATIPVGTQPQGIAYDSANGNMYVANYGDNTVSVISTPTNQVIATIPVGTHPQGIAFDPANREIYVANADSNTVSVISTTSPSSGDTTPPTISNIPSNIAVISSQGQSGAIVTYRSPTAVDNVDGQVPVICTPPSGSTFPIGVTTVICTATDSSRNTATARFTVTIITPSQAIQQLIQQIQSMNLNHGIQNSLIALLSNAERFLTDNNPHNDPVACNMLNVFINQVNQRIQITPSQSSQLIQAAQAIEKALVCR